MVILADFILEFRFEFLWPFWLLLRSVYDSFKYQGLVSVVTQLPISCNLTLSHTCQNLTIPFLSLSFRPSLYFLFVLHLRQTWFASFLSLCIGCFLLPALMFGCNTSGTQVCRKQIYFKYGQVYNVYLSKYDPHTDTVHGMLVGTKICRGILTFNQYKSLIRRFIFLYR